MARVHAHIVHIIIGTYSGFTYRRFEQDEMYGERFVAKCVCCALALVDFLCLAQIQRIYQGSWLMSVQ